MALICHHINKRKWNAKTRVTTAKTRDRLFMEKHFLCSRCSNILNSSHNSFFEMPCVFPVCAGLEIYWLFLIRFLYFKGKVLPAKQYLKMIWKWFREFGILQIYKSYKFLNYFKNMSRSENNAQVLASQVNI